MIEIKEIVKTYQDAEKDQIFPFSNWHRRDVFERLIKPFLITLGYNPDRINYEDIKGNVEIEIHTDLKIIMYISSIQEDQRFSTNKIIASLATIPSFETGNPKYKIAVVTNFEEWFFYFEGKEIYAVTVTQIEKEFNTIRLFLSRENIESGEFEEIARKFLHKEDNEPLRKELNILRTKIANKILQEETNLLSLENSDGSYNNEILNEITTRWITRFLSLKLAEDSGIKFNFTLRDIKRSFELAGKRAKHISEAKIKETTLNNAIRALMNEFERRFNGGIFMYEEGIDYITIPDSAFFDLLNFTTGWAFTIEDARIIGFVYERFLGQEIVIEEREGNLEAVLKNIGEARGRRKAGGIYYTPKYIVDYIVENTLGEILKEKSEKIENAVKNLDVDKFKETLKEVKSLKVLDPACGSGSFLIKVLAEFKNFYEEVKRKTEEIEKNIYTLRRKRMKEQILFSEDKEILELENKHAELQKEVDEIKFPGTFALRHNIYGVDLDPKAIDITAFTLMVQVYDELKEEARCPTMIGENLKIGNSLVSSLVPEKKNGFISRKELEKFKEEIKELIRLRKIEKSIDISDEYSLRELIKENFDEIVDIYLHIKERYPNAIPTSQQKLLDEWHKRAKKEPIEKTYDVLIYQTGLARIFLKEVYFEKIEKIKEKIEFEINKPLVKYFNSKKRVLKDKELEEILSDEERLKEEYRFIKDRAIEISKSQPPKVFNWEIEFPEVFFNEDGTLKENPGFDCIVGNPPWGNLNKLLGIQEPSEPFKQIWKTLFTYSCEEGKINSYKLFLELGSKILSPSKKRTLSMIIPSTFIGDTSSSIFRNFLWNELSLSQLIVCSENVTKILFDGQITQETCVTVMQRLDKTSFNNVRYKFVTKISVKEDFVQELQRLYSLSIDEWKKISYDNRFPFILYAEEISVLLKIMSIPKFKDNSIGLIGQGVLNETEHKRFILKTQKKYSKPIIKGEYHDRYFLDLSHPLFVNYKDFLDYKPTAREVLSSYSIIFRGVVNKNSLPRLRFTLSSNLIMTHNTNYIIINNNSISAKFLVGVLNSTLLEWIFRKFSYSNYIMTSEIGYLPIVRATPDQQAPLIFLVDAIIQKKKEYHSISQKIDDYVKFENCKIESLEDYLGKAVEDFSVVSSLKAKNDNFDALRIKIEDTTAILEYGIKRKIEEYEEIDEEDEQVESKGKYITDWYLAGKGKIKNKEAIEFLVQILEKEKRFSKTKQKTIWQKIVEVKVLEFNEKMKEEFLKFKTALEKAKQREEEILKIDRAIDRLVYDLYELTEEEIQTVEKSVWGEKFEEMYSKLPSKKSALKIAEEVKNV